MLIDADMALDEMDAVKKIAPPKMGSQMELCFRADPILKTTGVEFININVPAKSASELADCYTDCVDTHLVYLEERLAETESCYKKLCRTRDNILRQKAQGYKNLESQRAQAKKHVEMKICNIMNQIAYLNVCISHNGH